MSGIATDGQALLTGALAAAAMNLKYATGLAVEDVEVLRDDDGDYEPMFKVRMRSGTYLVIVTPVEE